MHSGKHESVLISAGYSPACITTNNLRGNLRSAAEQDIEGWGQCPAISELSLRETQKIVLNTLNFSTYAGTTGWGARL